MDMTTNTTRHEVRIDTKIAEAAEAHHEGARLLNHLQAEADRRDRIDPDRTVSDYEADKMSAAAAAFDAAVVALSDAQADYEGWSRFYLVQNDNGHIHSSMGCSTCRFDTRFGWLTELSGLTEAEAVDVYGGILCSVCFPSAPVEWTEGTNKVDAERKARDAEARRLAKTPEGKAVKGKSDLVTRKTHAVSSTERDIKWSTSILADPSSEDVREMHERRLAEAEAKLPKARKQLERAERQLAEAIETMTEIHGTEAVAILIGENQ